MLPSAPGFDDDPLGASLKGLSRAIELKEAGRLDEAEAAFADLLKRAGDDATILINAGLVALERRDLEAALARLSRAVEKFAGNGMAWAHYGAALHRAGRLEEADRALDRAIALRPDFPPARAERAAVRARMGGPPGAAPGAARREG
jgi:tetratricopeptide (TPR) repeat protein